jgi:hypothetical protein
MRRVLFALLVALVLPVALGPAGADAATPSGAVRTATLPSKQQWLADVSAALSGSETWLGQRVARGGGHLAIVLDIDNTSIATRYAWPNPVYRTRHFARYARQHGVSVFFVTGRLKSRIWRIKPVLRRAGYTWSGICGRRSGVSLATSKQACRRQIVAQGYTIVANVGNRPTDLVGGDYERGFKLPDYNGLLG